jgi:hypothetical protein
LTLHASLSAARLPFMPAIRTLLNKVLLGRA